MAERKGWIVKMTLCTILVFCLGGCSDSCLSQSHSSQNDPQRSRLIELKENTREGYPAIGIRVEYEYGSDINVVIGIPSGAKAYRGLDEGNDKKLVFSASGAELVDEEIKGEKTRLIKVNYSLYNPKDKEVAKLTAWFQPAGFSESYVVKTLLNNRYQANYNWESIPGHSLATVETIDTQNGKKVHEMLNLKFIRESPGLFAGTERHYDANGKVICEIIFIRHLGTGMLVKEDIVQGSLPRDYHTYEFVLMG